MWSRRKWFPLVEGDIRPIVANELLRLLYTRFKREDVRLVLLHMHIYVYIGSKNGRRRFISFAGFGNNINVVYHSLGVNELTRSRGRVPLDDPECWVKAVDMIPKGSTGSNLHLLRPMTRTLNYD